MNDPLLHGQTPAEYFKDLVDSALERQHLRANELTSYYLVNLLCGFVRPDKRPASTTPTGRWRSDWGARSRAAAVNNARGCAAWATSTLFMSGFFSDSFRRRSVDVDYYVSMGEYAYSSLSRQDEEAFGDVFAELAGKFVAFTDVLADVSERTGLASHSDILRLYEKWLRTRSPRDGQRLVDRGIIPNGSIGSRFLQ